MSIRNWSIVSLALCLAFATWAAPVSFDNALRVAENASKSKKLKLKHESTHKKHRAQKANAQEEPLLYVFQNDENKGFIIVAGDDTFKPIIGYSENGTYDSLNMPPNFAWYLESIQQEMAFALDNDFEQAAQAAQEWVALAEGGSYEPGTYLLTTKWAQYEPYYNQTPMIDGQRTPAGCVATAMAQIMKYHRHPSGALTGTIPGYITETEKLAIPPVDLANITFDWANMKDIYDSYTNTEAEAVATLMSVVGKSVEMNYSANSSGTFSSEVTTAFKEYFGYDSNVMKVDKDDFAGNWIAMLKEQINSNLPVFYAGGEVDRHAFVLDGYDSNDKFHFNWGLGGPYDGFFTLSNLNPGVYNYNSKQSAIINIKPIHSASAYPMTLNSNGRIIVQTTSNAILLSNLPPNAKVEVYNLQGKLIYSAYPENPRILKILVQTKGMYIVKANNQTAKVTLCQ